MSGTPVVHSVPSVGSKTESLREILARRGFEMPFTYDINLFQALNEHYAVRSVCPAPRDLTPQKSF
jgi:hypothetical protein